MTFKEACNRFFAWLEGRVKRQDVAAGTLVYYRSQLEPLAEQFGDTELRNLDPFALEVWLPTWHRWQSCRRLFRWALDHGADLEQSPLRGIHRSMPARRDRTLSRPETVRILRACSRPLRELLIAIRHTAGRPGEVRELRWREMVGAPSGTGIKVPVPMVFERIQYKAKKRRRVAPASRILVPDVRGQRLMARLLRRRAGGGGEEVREQSAPGHGGNADPSAGGRVLSFPHPAPRTPPETTSGQAHFRSTENEPDPQDFIFKNSAGRPWTKDYLDLALRRVCRRLGFQDQGIVPYVLRHTAATVAARNGVNLALLASYMGHSSVQTTQRYVHAQREDLDRVASMIGDRSASDGRQILKFPERQMRRKAEG